MDPFRDELAAAHAKIAELENEIRRLKTEQNPSYDAARSERQGRSLLVLIIGLACVLVIGAVALFISASRAGRTAGSGVASPAFSGVAIAPTEKSDTTAAPRSSSPALDKQNPYTINKPCNCQPGDPLCSCL